MDDPAQEFADIKAWINREPTTLGKPRGRPVLLECVAPRELERV
jgi:hypothetical protein